MSTEAGQLHPIVFAAAADPVGSGLVTNLARPGGNVTGLSNLTAELIGKRLELLTQAVPGVGQVAVLRLPGALGERTEKEMLTEAEVAARGLGVRLQFVETRDPADFDRAFSDMTRARAGALTLCQATCSSESIDASWTWRQGIGCRLCTLYGNLLMPGASCPTQRA